ncbi:hypothetical protein PMIN02_008892 [Paraphaeosphaeria minitans]|uniref:Transcription factor n=1 Tax=Paraphaeosphaeria minitans TaxID=565426 RepID=A0A9P6G935_9PLEO|nr:transcription factor [Paraphaeosphaeria minitans]
MPPDHRRSNVRRSNVTACVRCKARKQRCDQLLPACGNCERSGVECVGHDVDGSIVPRSYLKNLEDHVARLEKELQHYRSLSSPNVASAHVYDVEYTIAQASYVSVHPSTFPSPRHMGGGSGLPLLRLLLHNLGPPPLRGAVQIPASDVCLRLTEAYFEHSDFFSPILYRSDVLRILEIAFDTLQAVDKYKIHMILAVAIQLVNRTDASFPVAKAEAFASTANQFLLNNADNILTGDLQHLEVLLLSVQYASFSSSPAGTWHIIGQATRLAIDLGLHEEPPAHLSFGLLTLDRRKRLFWATYTYERNLCAVLGRPVSIPDESISVSLPVDLDDDYITEERLLPQSSVSRKALALHLIRYRQLESEIMQILHQRQPLASREFDHQLWRDDMRQRLYDWRANVPVHQSSTQLAPMEIFDGHLNNSLLHLYSPSRHMPIVSDDSMIFLADCAQKAIEAYRSSFQGGKLRFYWRTVHNLFRAGIAVIYCLKKWSETGCTDFDYMQKSTQTCSKVLWGMVERYPSGKPCRDIFDDLCQSVQQPSTRDDMRIRNDVIDLLDPNMFPFTFLTELADPLGLLPNDLMHPNANAQQPFAWGYEE